MTKILVTTDFSIYSKAAIYFAMQLAKQIPVSITFFHSYHIMKPTSFSKERLEAYVKERTEEIAAKLKTFINETAEDLRISDDQFNCVIKESVVPDGNILDYAENGGFDYICMGTRGAGRIEKIFGTNTSHVINKSEVPVIAVPINYTPKRITNLLYVSDLLSLKDEMKRIMVLARSLQVNVEVLHFSFPSDISRNTVATEHFRKQLNYPVKFNIQENDFQYTLVKNIATAAEKASPSLLVMFTNQTKSFFEKLLFSSNSENVAFNTKVPLLIFRKNK
ncbi:MAG TPA: universal stress protein [Pelobium sp.]|nr:universal stress protein [Pelobium sp.]